MSTRIYFARHGKYKNPDGVIPYRLPGFPLAEDGKRQAKEIVEKLKEQDIIKVFCSPILRCHQTAEIIANGLGISVEQKEELSETRTPLQGKTKKEMETLSPNYPFDIPEHSIGGGETPEEMYNRVHNLVQKTISEYKNKTILLVSHGDPIFIFLSTRLLGSVPHTHQDFDNKKLRYIPMGGLVELTFTDSGEVVYRELI